MIICKDFNDRFLWAKNYSDNTIYIWPELHLLFKTTRLPEPSDHPLCEMYRVLEHALSEFCVFEHH